MVNDSVAVAIEMHESKVRGALVAGNQVSSQQEITMPSGPSTPAEVVASLARGLMPRSSERGQVRVLGVAVSGMFDVVSGVWRKSHPRGVWKNVTIVSDIERTTGTRTIGIRLGDAVAIAERKFGAGQIAPSFLSLHVGWDDIYGGLLLNDTSEQIIRGSLGHIIVDPEPNARCLCGISGTLSAFASASALIHRYEDLLGPSVTRDNSLEILVTLLDEASRGDETAVSVLRVAGGLLGEAITGLITGKLLLGVVRMPVQTVLVGAAFPGIAEALVAEVRRSLTKMNSSVVVEAGVLGANAPLLGAGLVARGFPERRW